MSNLSNINNSLYEFELALVNTKQGSEVYLPITKGSVEYLEVEDSLAFFGYNGNVKIDNFAGILQQLNILDVDGINCMYIGIKNNDLAKAEADPDSRMGFLALFNQGSESSKNSIEKSLNFNFEEYFVARLKHESIFQIGDKKTLVDTPGKLIHQLLSTSNKESVNEIATNSNTKDAFFNLTDENPATLGLCDFYKAGTTSLYDIIAELYRYLSYTSQTKGPGILAAANIIKDGVLQRKFTLQSMATYIQKFYQKYRQGNVQDMSDFVTDIFAIGSASDAATLNTNFIDTYDFINTDQNDILSNKWVDYIIADSGNNDLSNVNTPSVLYEQVKYDFATEMLAGLAPNLPDASARGTQNRKIVQKKVNDSNLTKIYIENSLKKSFIFDNKALNFTVPGNIYRRAGKFIKINDTGSPGELKNDKKRNIDGYWFVISIKHIFKGDYYTNEYVCVKLHRGDNTDLAQKPAVFAGIAPALNSSLLPPIPVGALESAAAAAFKRNNPVGTSTVAAPDNNGIVNTPLEGKAPPITAATPTTQFVTPGALNNFIKTGNTAK